MVYVPYVPQQRGHRKRNKTVPVAEPLIDRLSATPYYQQLCEMLEARIGRSELKVGTRLPSEHDLCAEFGLSRATVRQALQELEKCGAVERVPGRGVFVRDREIHHGWVIQGTEGFLENAVGHQNRSVETRVLAYGAKRLPKFAASVFGVAEGETGFELIRFRSLDGVPALYSINYSPPPLIPVIIGAEAVLEGRASFSALLTTAGYTLGGADRKITAVAAPKDISELLEVKKNAPLIQIRSISWMANGTAFDVYDTWLRSDVVPLEVTVNAFSMARN